MPFIPSDPTRPANPSIEKATQAVNAAALEAAADPNRPVYHFLPPSHWLNDPNGTIFHNGFFQVFYQQNPYTSGDGPKFWGHTRTKDLVHWEHLPIALAPANELGEDGCWSGCARVNAEGTPMLFYTKVNLSAGEKDRFEQWAAVGDPDWITWQRHPKNPILSLDTHGEPNFDRGWRDPFIFSEGGRTFIIVGATNVGTPIFEATDGTLANWAKRGFLVDFSTECPNFFKVDDWWVLLGSPFENVHYYTGKFDLSTCRFTPQLDGILDYGDFHKSCLYATNVASDDKGRCILFGWVLGVVPERAWNGCLALPRVLHVSPQGKPIQQPVPELECLRYNHAQSGGFVLTSQPQPLPGIRGDAVEIKAVFDCPENASFKLSLRSDADGQNGADLVGTSQSLVYGGVTIPFDQPGRQVRLQIFIDKTVMEVFVNDGVRTMTQLLTVPPSQCAYFVSGTGGAALESLDSWKMQAIW